MATVQLPGKSTLDMASRKITGVASDVNDDSSAVNYGQIKDLGTGEVTSAELASSNVWQESIRNDYAAGQTVFDFETITQGNVTVETQAIGGGAVGYTLDPLPMAQGDLTNDQYEALFTVVPSGTDSLEIQSIDDESGLLTFVDAPTQSFTITYPPVNFGATLGFSSRQYSRRATPSPDPLPEGGLERPIDGTYNQEDFGLNASAYWIRIPINGRFWHANQNFIVGDVVSYVDENGTDRRVYCEFAHLSSEATNPLFPDSIVHEEHVNPIAASPWRPIGSSINISTGEFEVARQILVSEGGDPAVLFANPSQIANIPANEPQQWVILIGDSDGVVKLPEGQEPLVGDLISFGTGNVGTTEEYRVSVVDDEALQTILRFVGTIPADLTELVATGDPIHIFDAGPRQDFGQVDRLVFDPADFAVNTEAQNIGHAHVATHPQEMVARQVLRNSAGQTVEQWIAETAETTQANTAQNFVSDATRTENLVTLAKNEAIQTTPFSNVEFATEQNGDYHVDLLYYSTEAGRVILNTERVQTGIDGRLEVVNSLPGTAVGEVLNTENAVNNQAVYLAVEYTDEEAEPNIVYTRGTYSYSTDTNTWTQTGGSGGTGGVPNGAVVHVGATSTVGGVQIASTEDVLQDGNSNGEIPIWDNDEGTWLRYHLLINGIDPVTGQDRTENFILDEVSVQPTLRATTRAWQEANLLEKVDELPQLNNVAGDSVYLTTQQGDNVPGAYTFQGGAINNWVQTGLELLPATVATLGGMRPGAGLSIDGDGIVSANPVVQNDQITVPNVAGVIPRIQSSTALEQSTMSDNGTLVTMSGGLQVDLATNIDGALTVGSPATINNNLSVTQDATITGTLNGGATNTMSWWTLQLNAGTPIVITEDNQTDTGIVLGTSSISNIVNSQTLNFTTNTYLAFLSTWNGGDQVVVDIINNTTGATVTHLNTVDGTVVAQK